MNPPLIYREVGIFEKDIDQDFFVKMGGGSIEVGVGKHCFSLIRYGFCRGNVLYSASLSVTMCIFLLTPFDA